MYFIIYTKCAYPVQTAHVQSGPDLRMSQYRVSGLQIVKNNLDHDTLRG